MKVMSRIQPHSSVVGGGLTLLDEDGRPAFMVIFAGTTKGIRKEETEALAWAFNSFVNRQGGIEVPDRTDGG